jgi:hypothetical protein
MNQKVVLIVGGLLILFGLTKFDLGSVIPFKRPSAVDLMEITAPSDEKIKKEAQDVIDLLKVSNGSKADFKKLRDLSLDLGRLVELDGEDLVVKNTDEIRQANSISGVMLRLDIKGKYPNLAKEAKEVIVSAIGDDNIPLSSDLRNKAVIGFNALAWAYNEASK